MFITRGDALIQGCYIRSNTTKEGYAGGVLCYEVVAEFVGGGVTGNTSDYHGGGIAIVFDSQVALTNLSVCDNSPDQILGTFSDLGDVCIAFNCHDGDGNGWPDKCESSTGDGILRVPDEYPTIQEAIEAAGYGDTVLVGPGTYTGTGWCVINPGGKPITIRASDGPEATVLDGQYARSVIACMSGESGTTVIDGFSIRNGAGTLNGGGGGGLVCYFSSPTLTNCRIYENSGSFGGGVACHHSSSPVLLDCTIVNNSVTAKDFCCGYGGAIYCTAGSNPVLINCVISGNAATDEGGGIYCAYNSSPVLTNCVIDANTAYAGGGVYCENDSNPTITGCTIEGNTANYGGGIYCNNNSSPTLTECTISGNTATIYGGGSVAPPATPR